MKAKKLKQALQELSEEGVTQVFLPTDGSAPEDIFCSDHPRLPIAHRVFSARSIKKPAFINQRQTQATRPRIAEVSWKGMPRA
jgi:hypothetical protein